MNVSRLPTKQERYAARIEACATALDPAIASCASSYGTWILIAALTQSYEDVLHHLYLTDRAQAQALLHKVRQIMEAR